jgi:DNA-binding response OmpR family regulator
VFAAKILIVDDDAEIRQLLGEELRDLGHESIYAADGVQALSLVRRERPDLILLDLRLPAGDGFCVLERLRRIPEVAYTPVIVFSGMRSPEAEERALMLGAREFVHKSFSGNDLIEAITRVLEQGPATGPAPLQASKRGEAPSIEGFDGVRSAAARPMRPMRPMPAS